MGVAEARGQVERAPRSVAPALAGFGSSSANEDRGFLDAVRKYGSVERYGETPAAGLKLYHYSAALKFDLPSIGGSRWKLFADFGLGATELKSNEYQPYAMAGDRTSEMFLSLRGGLTLEYAVSRNCSAFLSGREFFYLNDTGVAIDILGGSASVVESGSWSFP
ncbi:MAG: hypothetical protein JSU87_03700, partial [Gemmatimonadota bacterium]